MSKFRALLLLPAVALLLVASADTAHAGDGTSQLDLMPADTNVLININLKRMRGSKGLAEVMSMAEKSDDFKKVSESLGKAGVKLDRDVDTVSMGLRSTGTGDPDGMVVVAEGRFKLAKIVAAMKKKNPDMKRKSHRGVTYYQFADDGALLVVKKQLVMTEVKRVKDVIDLSKRKGKSVKTNGTVKRLRARTDTKKDIWFVAEVPKKKAGAGFGGPPMAEKIRSMTGSVDMKTGLGIRLRIGFSDAKAPTELVSQFEMLKPMAGEQLKQMGLTGVLDKTVLLADEKDVVMKVDLTAAEAQKLKNVVEQAGGAM